MSETMLSESAATTTEGQATTQAAESAQATAANAQSAQQQATEGQSGAQDGAKAEGQGEGAQKVAPEKYEFKAPEGREFDPQMIEQFSEVAKDLGMTQDAAQKVLDKMGPALEARQTEVLKRVSNDWAEATRADKEFGGEKLNENLALAKKALNTFGSDDLRTLLNESGIGNHPEVIRFMYRAGKAISGDGKLVVGSAAPADASKNVLNVLYDNSVKKE